MAKNLRVFLGGTCAGYKWRNDLIPMLECDYYNPIVKNWCEEDRQREVFERNHDDFVLYVITSGLKGVYSIAEIIDDSNKRPDKTLICFLYDGFGNQMTHSLKAVKNLAISNGAKVFNSLEEISTFLNYENKKFKNI